MVYRVDIAAHGVETPYPTVWLIAGCLGFVESAASGEDRFPSPDHKSFHTSTNPTNRGKKRWSPGSIPGRTVCKPLTHWLIADWTRIGEPPPPKEDEALSPDQKSFHTSASPTNLARKRWLIWSIPSRTVWKPPIPLSG